MLLSDRGPPLPNGAGSGDERNDAQPGEEGVEAPAAPDHGVLALPAGRRKGRDVGRLPALEALAEAGVRCWADKASQGADGTVRVPYHGRWENRSAGQKAVNHAHAKIRAVGEQVMATLKTWRLLRKHRCSTNRITDLVKAILTLQVNASTRRDSTLRDE